MFNVVFSSWVKVLYVLGAKRPCDDPQPAPAPKRNAMPVSRYTNLEQAYIKKQSVIPIRNIGNDLCCASALIMALERQGNTQGVYNKYKVYQNANQIKRRAVAAEEFTKAARFLHELAGNYKLINQLN